MKRRIILGIVSLLLLAACQPQDPAANVQKVNETATQGANPDSSSIKEFDMVARQWKFEPSTIRVNQNDKVVLKIKNEDVPHGFAISELGINQRLEPGKTTIVKFTASKKGEFSFFCFVPCGEGHGNMKGKLIVE